MENHKETVEIEFCDDKIIIHSEIYSESGWFLICTKTNFKLFEIPLFGGEPRRAGEFENIVDAINFTKKLT